MESDEYAAWQQMGVDEHGRLLLSYERLSGMWPQLMLPPIPSETED
jgi:hypothetical protein